jgi:23S rRNA pseudouridine2605 synthase
MASVRIQKVLASAGFGGRRACEQLVIDGRVSVNGHVHRSLPVMVDPQKDQVMVDGRTVRQQKQVYFLMNKPKGVFCTTNDPDGRTCAVDLIPQVRERLFTVGRIDGESTGLLILTNDGSLAQKLTHPRFSTPKTYRVEVAGCPTGDSLDKLRKGIWLPEGRSPAAQIEFIHKHKDHSVLEITLREGRDREIRRMLAKMGHNVRRLHRICMGKLSIRKVPVGGHRPLTRAEIEYLYKLAEESRTAPITQSFRQPNPNSQRPARRLGRMAGARPARSAAKTSARPAAKSVRRPPTKPARRIIGPEPRS